MSMKKSPPKHAGKDPHAKREAAKYSNPLPSREYILEVMEKEGTPVTTGYLYELLRIRDDEREILNRRLNAMEREGQIMRNRKGALCIAEKINLIAGKVQGHADGFGFLIPDAGGDDLFLSPKEMLLVMHGDRAMVRPAGLDRKGRPEGKIVEVLERSTKRLVGRLIRERGVVLVAAEDKRIHHDVLIPPGKDMKAKAGQIVMVELIEQPSAHAQPIGEVKCVYDSYASPKWPTLSGL